MNTINKYLMPLGIAVILALAALTWVVFTGISTVYAGSGDQPGNNDSLDFRADLTGAEEVPAVITDTTGKVRVKVEDEMTEAEFKLEVRDGMAVTASHLHCAMAGENGPVIAFLFDGASGGVDVDGELAEGTLTDADILDAGKKCALPVTNIESLAHALKAGIIYANVHNVAYPAGVIRGQLMSN